MPQKYKVRRGDNLALLARRIWNSDDPALVQRLIEANPKLRRRPNLLYVGETLLVLGPSGGGLAVPGGAAVASRQDKAAQASLVGKESPKRSRSAAGTSGRAAGAEAKPSKSPGRLGFEKSGRPASASATRPQRGSEQKTAERWYTIRQNESLADIAGRELGNPRRWREIAELNRLRDPDRVNAGRRIRLPAEGESSRQG